MRKRCDEGVGWRGDHSPAPGVAVLVGKADASVVGVSEDAIGAQGGLVDVAGEVAQGGTSLPDGLAVHPPLGGVEVARACGERWRWMSG